MSTGQDVMSGSQLTIVAMSDTHGYHRELNIPPGDILLHAGDMTLLGTLSEVREFNEFLAELDHEHKIVIAGNHDFCFEREPRSARKLLTACQYLEDAAVEVCGLIIYGSPWQPSYHDWAFNLPRGAALARKWAAIPRQTDILVTHGPPYGIGDKTCSGHHVGCEDLLTQVQLIKPIFHIFGHIHEATGLWRSETTTFVNVCTIESLQEPIILQIPC